MKKLVTGIALVFLVFSLLLPKNEVLISAKENEMMHTSLSKPTADEEVKEINKSYSYIDNLGDFSINYVKDTYFELEMNGKYFYNQGYYITVNQTGEKVFCIEPDVMIGKIKNNTLSEGKYSEFPLSIQTQISDYIMTGLNVYKETGDEEYLVATQILVWQEVGATILDISSNISQKMMEISNLKVNLRNDINYTQTEVVTDENITPLVQTQQVDEQDVLESYEVSDTTDTNNIADTESNDVENISSNQISEDSLDEILLEDISSYEGQTEQYVTEGQDVVTVSDNVNFNVYQEVLDESGDEIVSPGETLEYTVKIENNLTAPTDFLVSEEYYNEYLTLTENDEIKVNSQEYTVEDLISSNFIIEDVNPGSDIQFKFEVKTTADYDGEIIKNNIKVCNTADDTCVNSETKIMGNTIQENVAGNPYAKIKEEEVTTEKIQVAVSGADVNDLLKNGVDVNLYLDDEVIDSKNIDLGNEEEENIITFENEILPSTKYKITVEGEYVDYQTKEEISGVLKDGTPQQIEAQLEVETPKDQSESLEDLQVDSELEELTNNSIKFSLKLGNSSEKISSARITFINSDDNTVETELTEESLEDLLNGEEIEVEQTELSSETEYDVTCEFYDDSDNLIASESLGKIITDTEAPIITLDSSGNKVEAGVASGKILINNKQSIINSTENEEDKIILTLTEYGSDDKPLTIKSQSYSVDDEISYSFSDIVFTNKYKLTVSTKYNVDMMFNLDDDEGDYKKELISFKGNGEVLYSELSVIYDIENEIVGTNSITVEFQIINPNSKIIDNNSITTRACKIDDLNMCLAVPPTSISKSTYQDKYSATITGLESNTSYKLITNADISNSIGETPINLDILGVNSTDEFSTNGEGSEPLEEINKEDQEEVKEKPTAEEKYKLYVKSKKNEKDSYTKNTAQIGVELLSFSSNLNDLTDISINVVNKNDSQDKHIIKLNNSQVDKLKGNEEVDLYLSDLKVASEYSVYASCKIGNEEIVIDSDESIYTDYNLPEVRILSKKIQEDSAKIEIGIGENSNITNIKMVNDSLGISQDIEIIDNRGDFVINDIDPNQEYDFSIEYDYIINNESYLPVNVNSGKTTFSIYTDEEEEKNMVDTCQDLLNIKNDLIGNYYVEEDIDCEGVEFVSIPSFAGVIDGQGHTISNINIKKDDMKNVGIININSGQVRNIVFDNLSIEGNENTGVIGKNMGIVEDITLNNLNLKSKVCQSDVIGENYGIVRNVTYTGDIDCEEDIKDDNKEDLEQELDEEEESQEVDENKSLSESIDDILISEDDEEESDKKFNDLINKLKGVEESR